MNWVCSTRFHARNKRNGKGSHKSYHFFMLWWRYLSDMRYEIWETNYIKYVKLNILKIWKFWNYTWTILIINTKNI